jgi:hypothetical protein
VVVTEATLPAVSTTTKWEVPVASIVESGPRWSGAGEPAARLALAEGGEDEEPGAALARSALRALQDRDSGVRTTVLGWLAEHPVLPVAELAPIFDPDDERVRTIEERLTAVDALAALAVEGAAAAGGSADPGTDPAVALLLSVTDAAELTVRRRAVEALAALGLPRPDPGHHATRLPPGVYASILDQTGVPPAKSNRERLRIVDSQVDRLEADIDKLNADLAPLNSFVLPGGKPAAAHLHLARTVCRRAERLVVKLAADKNEAVGAPAIRYLNRLSDLLFVAARYVNGRGADDILWVPGAHR